MKQQGGSFAAALATAWERADAQNSALLEQAFGPLLERYCRMDEVWKQTIAAAGQQ